jgi:hypothetical protein
VPKCSGGLYLRVKKFQGLVASVSTCGGLDTGIPLRVGRIDATEAGPSGVPEPTTDLETTLAQFASAGFSQSETIALT